jgi:hypothetical protein
VKLNIPGPPLPSFFNPRIIEHEVIAAPSAPNRIRLINLFLIFLLFIGCKITKKTLNAAKYQTIFLSLPNQNNHKNKRFYERF